jgi:hypothetical protein
MQGPSAGEPAPFGVGKQNLKPHAPVDRSGNTEKPRFFGQIPRIATGATAHRHQTLTKMSQI